MVYVPSTAMSSTIFGLTLKQLLAVLIPIILIQAGLVIAALINLRRQNPAAIKGGKLLWAIILIICLIEYPLGLLGPILYFTIARKPYESE